MGKEGASKKESENMNPIYLYIYFVLAILACPVAAEDLPDVSLSDNASIDTVSPDDDVKRFINESNLLINAIALRGAQHGRGELYVIGEVALSRVEEDLGKLLGDGQSSKLVESGEFSKLYSDMSFAFGTQRIPIKLSRYVLPEKQILIENNLSSEDRLAGPLYEDEYLFEPTLPNQRMLEISKGYTETSGGVNVIWDY